METFAGFDDISSKSIDLDVPYPVYLFYPTPDPSVLHSVGPFTFEASPQASWCVGKFPLVIISHGSGGAPLLYRALAIGLAKSGCVVALPEHPFNNRLDNSRAESIENLTQRPKQISEVIDQVMAHPIFAPHLLNDQVAVIGHSMGGYAALAAAGGIPHTKHQIAYNPHGIVKISMEIPARKDERIRSLILLAPAAGWFLSEGALESVTVPIHIVVAEHDELTSIRHSDCIKAGAINSSALTQWIVPNAGHFSFLTPFPEKMRTSRFLPALDPVGFDREGFQIDLLQDVIQALVRHGFSLSQPKQSREKN